MLLYTPDYKVQKTKLVLAHKSAWQVLLFLFFYNTSWVKRSNIAQAQQVDIHVCMYIDTIPCNASNPLLIFLSTYSPLVKLFMFVVCSFCFCCKLCQLVFVSGRLNISLLLWLLKVPPYWFALDLFHFSFFFNHFLIVFDLNSYYKFIYFSLSLTNKKPN